LDLLNKSKNIFQKSALKFGIQHRRDCSENPFALAKDCSGKPAPIFLKGNAQMNEYL